LIAPPFDHHAVVGGPLDHGFLAAFKHAISLSISASLAARAGNASGFQL